MSFEILNMISTLRDLAPLVAGHHEQYSGAGYPFGLKGKQIPLGARILAVCDAFDAMISYRPYRRHVETKFACEEIERFSGRQFDPEVVEKAIPLFKSLMV
jgi:HD-GYP domain-containing protein (c-di-GMP phosphodiesterase class II)